MRWRRWAALALVVELTPLAAACGHEQVVRTPEASPGELAARYAAARQRLEQERERLAVRWQAAATDVAARAAVLREARQVVWRAVRDDLVPSWLGTPWTFNGHTVTPGQGSIACGYFVTTVVRDAGFDIDRIGLAQAVSEKIILTLAPPAATWRFSDRDAADVLAEVRAAGGDGLYAVGLDHHAALLVLDGERADLCHASFYGGRAVACEDADAAHGFVSRYRVIGKLFEAQMLVPWLEGAHIASADAP